MKKKMLIGTVNMEVGGIEKTLIGLLKRIDYKKYDIDLLLLKTNGDFIKDIPKEVNIITPYKTNTMENICNSSKFICKVVKHLLFNYFTGAFWSKKTKYDVAISYSGYYGFIDSFVASSNANKKLIWVHTDLNYIYNSDKIYRHRFNLTKGKYNKFDDIVCVSESIKKSVSKLLPMHKEKVKVQWNIVDINKNNDDYPTIDGEKKLISVGRICSQKRFDKLVEVHKKLIKDGINVKTYLVGAGEEMEQIKSLVNENNIQDTFIFLGKQINVENIVKQADLFVSTSDYEGLPTVLFETLDAGVPFIGTDVAGTSDVANFIAPKGSSMLVKNNVDAIYKGVKKALEGNLFKKFKFNIEEYNKERIKEFYNLINK